MPESAGALTEAVYYILLSLFEPLHGYGIMQRIANLSHGRLHMGAGTLYGAINTLLQKGWIQSYGDDAQGRKKEYLITDQGKRTVQDEIVRLNELLENGRKTLGGM